MQSHQHQQQHNNNNFKIKTKQPTSRLQHLFFSFFFVEKKHHKQRKPIYINIGNKNDNNINNMSSVCVLHIRKGKTNVRAVFGKHQRNKNYNAIPFVYF